MHAIEDAPQGTTLTGRAPAGLIHVQRRCAAQPSEQVGVRLGAPALRE